MRAALDLSSPALSTLGRTVSEKRLTASLLVGSVASRKDIELSRIKRKPYEKEHVVTYTFLFAANG